MILMFDTFSVVEQVTTGEVQFLMVCDYDTPVLYFYLLTILECSYTKLVYGDLYGFVCYFFILSFFVLSQHSHN